MTIDVFMTFLLLALPAQARDAQPMVMGLKVEPFADLILQFFNALVAELHHPAALYAQQVVVVLLSLFVEGMPVRLKNMPD